MTAGPFCTIPGCTDSAEGAVLFAYVNESRRYLCGEHMRPIRRALLDLIGEVPPGYRRPSPAQQAEGDAEPMAL